MVRSGLTKTTFFGKVEGETKWVTLEEIEDDFQKKDWLPEMKEGKGLIRSWVRSLDRDWEACQIWGFSEVNGVRYFTRRVVCKTPKKTLTARLVYDYISPVTGA